MYSFVVCSGSLVENISGCNIFEGSRVYGDTNMYNGIYVVQYFEGIKVYGHTCMEVTLVLRNSSMTQMCPSI